MNEKIFGYWKMDSTLEDVSLALYPQGVAVMRELVPIEVSFLTPKYITVWYAWRTKKDSLILERCEMNIKKSVPLTIFQSVCALDDKLILHKEKRVYEFQRFKWHPSGPGVSVKNGVQKSGDKRQEGTDDMKARSC
jgi:hypothetical protein